MANQEDIVQLLQGVTVFEALAPDDLRRGAQVAVPRRSAAGQVIFREGDASDTCYVVRSGHCRAVRENIDGRNIALDDVEAIAIAGSDMRRLMRAHADIAVKLVIGVARRLREANERLTRQSFQTVQSRVAGVLLQLVEQAQAEGAGPRDVLLKVTQAEIAQLAGSSCESASRFLAVLERAGVITQGRGRITVHGPDALANYVY